MQQDLYYHRFYRGAVYVPKQLKQELDATGVLNEISFSKFMVALLEQQLISMREVCTCCGEHIHNDMRGLHTFNGKED